VNLRFSYLPFILLAVLYLINFAVSKTFTEDEMLRCERTPTKPPPVAPIVSEEAAVELSPVKKRKKKNAEESRPMINGHHSDDEEEEEEDIVVDTHTGIVDLEDQHEIPIASVGEIPAPRPSPKLRVLNDEKVKVDVDIRTSVDIIKKAVDDS